MAKSIRPDETGETGPGRRENPDQRDDDLERRRRELEAKLAARMPAKGASDDGARSGGTAGYGQALKLSSEFIAGIAVGAGLGWMIDHFAGTSPWGLIVFLLLGFGAGIMNVLRSAGMMAEQGAKRPEDGRDADEK